MNCTLTTFSLCRSINAPSFLLSPAPSTQAPTATPFLLRLLLRPATGLPAPYGSLRLFCLETETEAQGVEPAARRDPAPVRRSHAPAAVAPAAFTIFTVLIILIMLRYW